MADKEGTIIRNKATGKALRLEGNQWVDYNDPPPAWVDAIKSIPGGLVKGGVGLITTPLSLADLASRGIDLAAGKFASPETAEKVHQGAEAFQKAVYPGTYEGGMEQIQKDFGPLYEPQTTAGRITQGVGEYAPMMFGGEGSLAARVGQGLLRGGIASGTAEGASQAAQAAGVDPSYDPLIRALAGAGGYGLPSLVRKGVTPNPLTGPEGELRQQHLDILRQHGIPVPASQAVNSPRIAAWEGRGGVQPPGQAQQITQALLGNAGVDAPLATKDVLTQANLGVRKNTPQWYQLQAIGKAADPATGIIDPAKLAKATAKKIPSSSLSKLSDAAANVTKPITPTELGTSWPTAVGTVAGGGIGVGRALSSGTAAVEDPLSLIGLASLAGGGAGASAAEIARRGAGALARTKYGQDYLANQLWKPGNYTTMDPKTAAALLANPATGLPQLAPPRITIPLNPNNVTPDVAPPISQ